MSNYTIWCEKLQEDIEFDSFINDANIEMFNLTTIAKQFNYTNKNIVDWFNMNISTLNIIDSIITEEELNDNEELLCISDNTIIKNNSEWYVNFNVLIEYLRKINFSYMNEVIIQIMIDKVNTELELTEEITTENSDEEYTLSEEYDDDE